MNTQTLVSNMTQKQIEAQNARNIASRIAIRQRALEMTFIEQGEDLILMCQMVRISDTEEVIRYKLIGYETFESFAASPDVNVGVRSAKLYKSVVLKYVHELKLNTPDDLRLLSDIGVSKLGLLWYHVNEENVRDWLAQANELTRTDLLKSIDDTVHQFTDYDAEQNELFVQRLHIDRNAPAIRQQNQVIHFLVNELMRLRPEINDDRSFQTAVDVMRRFASE